MRLALVSHRYLVSRRLLQVLIPSLFVAGNLLGWKVLRGNLSTSKVLDSFHLADPFAVLQIAAAGNLVDWETLAGAVIVLVFFAVLGGRMFCSWVCPVNIVTDLANWLRKRMGADFAMRDLQVGRTARYWAVGVSLVLSAFFGFAAFEQVSPISMLHRGMVFGVGLGWALVLAIFCFDLFMLRHGFCGHLCPLGGLYALAGRYSILRVRHEKDTCTLCMKCVEHCPEPQVLPMVGKRAGVVLSGECTNCAKCIEVCDERAMGFALRFAAPAVRKDLNP